MMHSPQTHKPPIFLHSQSEKIPKAPQQVSLQQMKLLDQRTEASDLHAEEKYEQTNFSCSKKKRRGYVHF